MSRRAQLILVVVSTLTFLVCLLGIAGTMVSLQYEVEAGECVSGITGHNLCQMLSYWQCAAVAVALLVVLLIFLPYKRRKAEVL